MKHNQSFSTTQACQGIVHGRRCRRALNCRPPTWLTENSTRLGSARRATYSAESGPSKICQNWQLFWFLRPKSTPCCGGSDLWKGRGRGRVVRAMFGQEPVLEESIYNILPPKAAFSRVTLVSMKSINNVYIFLHLSSSFVGNSRKFHFFRSSDHRSSNLMF